MNFTNLQAYIDNLYLTEGIPSSDIVVYHRGEEIFRHSAGFQDVATGEPLRRDALYFMYSATKLLTCVAGMQLLERGAFRMCDPIARYLPEFAHMKVKVADGRGQISYVPAKPILVEHLFTMTAGFAYEIGAPEIKACIAEHNGAPSTADIIRAYAARPLYYQPGERWMYSFAHDILLRLLEVIAGEPFSAYAQRNILDPTGMKNTYFHLTDDLRPRMAAQYRFEASLGKAVDVGLKNAYIFGPNYESGGAGLISCLDDYLLFAETLTHMGLAPNGNRILAPETVDLLRTDRLHDGNRADFDMEFVQGYGYGFGVRTLVDPAFCGTLSSLGEFGWDGAAGAYIHCDPTADLTIVYLQHMLNSKHQTVQPRLRNLVYAGLDD